MDNVGFEIRILNGQHKLVRRGHPSTSENSGAVAASTSLGAIRAAWSLLVPGRPFPERPEQNEEKVWDDLLNEV